MYHPQEIEVWYALPAIRREICLELKSRGMKQRQMAKLLGLTEAAVSQYISAKRAKNMKFSDEFTAEVRKLCIKIEKRKIDPFAAIQMLSKKLLETKELCRLHRRFDSVPRACNICLRI